MELLPLNLVYSCINSVFVGAILLKYIFWDNLDFTWWSYPAYIGDMESITVFFRLRRKQVIDLDLLAVDPDDLYL